MKSVTHLLDEYMALTTCWFGNRILTLGRRIAAHLVWLAPTEPGVLLPYAQTSERG